MRTSLRLSSVLLYSSLVSELSLRFAAVSFPEIFLATLLFDNLFTATATALEFSAAATISFSAALSAQSDIAVARPLPKACADAAILGPMDGRFPIL